MLHNRKIKHRKRTILYYIPRYTYRASDVITAKGVIKLCSVIREYLGI